MTLACRRIRWVPLCAGRQAGDDFVLKLVKLLHGTVRVRPTPYHGALFIGRDCLTIGGNSAIVCASQKGKVSETHLVSYELTWLPWNGVRKTLNGTAVIPPNEVARFCRNTAAVVAMLKCSFPRRSISLKLNIFMYHAPDCLQSIGSTGIYWEQGLEAWRGRCGEDAVKYLMNRVVMTAQFSTLCHKKRPSDRNTGTFKHRC